MDILHQPNAMLYQNAIPMLLRVESLIQNENIVKPCTWEKWVKKEGREKATTSLDDIAAFPSSGTWELQAFGRVGFAVILVLAHVGIGIFDLI